MPTPLERYLKVAGTGPNSTIELEDWNGLIRETGGLLAGLIEKGASFDAVATVAIGVLLDRINDVLGPAYDNVQARGEQVEALYARLNGQGVAAAAIVTDATHRFLTDAQITDLQARVTGADLATAVAGVRGTVDATHDTLGELATLVDAATAAAAANTTALAGKADAAATTAALGNRLRGDVDGGYAAGVQDQFRANLASPLRSAPSGTGTTTLTALDLDRPISATGTRTFVAGSFANGNWRSGPILHANPQTGNHTLGVPSGATLDGVLNGTTTLLPGQAARLLQVGAGAGAYVTVWEIREPRVFKTVSSSVTLADLVLPQGYAFYEFGVEGLTVSVNNTSVGFRIAAADGTFKTSNYSIIASGHSSANNYAGYVSSGLSAVPVDIQIGLATGRVSAVRRGVLYPGDATNTPSMSFKSIVNEFDGTFYYRESDMQLDAPLSGPVATLRLVALNNAITGAKMSARCIPAQ